MGGIGRWLFFTSSNSSTQNKSTQDLSKKTSDTVGDNSDSRGFEASKDNISLNIRTDHGPSIGFGLTVTLRGRWTCPLQAAILPVFNAICPRKEARPSLDNNKV